MVVRACFGLCSLWLAACTAPPETLAVSGVDVPMAADQAGALDSAVNDTAANDGEGKDSHYRISGPPDVGVGPVEEDASDTKPPTVCKAEFFVVETPYGNGEIGLQVALENTAQLWPAKYRWKFTKHPATSLPWEPALMLGPSPSAPGVFLTTRVPGSYELCVELSGAVPKGCAGGCVQFSVPMPKSRMVMVLHTPIYIGTDDCPAGLRAAGSLDATSCPSALTSCCGRGGGWPGGGAYASMLGQGITKLPSGGLAFGINTGAFPRGDTLALPKPVTASSQDVLHLALQTYGGSAIGSSKCMPKTAEIHLYDKGALAWTSGAIAIPSVAPGIVELGVLRTAPVLPNGTPRFVQCHQATQGCTTNQRCLATP